MLTCHLVFTLLVKYSLSEVLKVGICSVAGKYNVKDFCELLEFSCELSMRIFCRFPGSSRGDTAILLVVLIMDCLYGIIKITRPRSDGH